MAKALPTAEIDYDYGLSVIWISNRRVWERPRGEQEGDWVVAAVEQLGLDVKALCAAEAAALEGGRR